MQTRYFICAVALFITAFRLNISTNTLSVTGSYQAFAHLFVGGLIGAWLTSKDKLYGLLSLYLIVVEIIAFILGHLP